MGFAQNALEYIISFRGEWFSPFFLGLWSANSCPVPYLANVSKVHDFVGLDLGIGKQEEQWPGWLVSHWVTSFGTFPISLEHWSDSHLHFFERLGSDLCWRLQGIFQQFPMHYNPDLDKWCWTLSHGARWPMMDSWFPWIQQLSSKAQISEHVSTVITMLSHALQDCRLLTCEILGSQLKLWKSRTRWSFWSIFHHFRIWMYMAPSLVYLCNDFLQTVYLCVLYCILYCGMFLSLKSIELLIWFEIPFAVVTTFIWWEQQYGCRFLPQSSCCPRYYRYFKSLSPKQICHFSGCGNEPWWMLRLSSLMHPTGERCSLPEATPRSREGGEANLGVWKASTKYLYIHFSDFSVFVFCW